MTCREQSFFSLPIDTNSLVGQVVTHCVIASENFSWDFLPQAIIKNDDTFNNSWIRALNFVVKSESYYAAA